MDGLENLAEDLQTFCSEFHDMFVCHRWDNSRTAHQYLCGLIQSDRRNIERMEENVADTDYEAMQQFISGSPWDERAVINRVAIEGDKLIGGTGYTGLLIDESAFQKKGKASAGVARQWNGRLGKTENSQVAVFGVLSAGDRAIPIDVELFLPDEWTEDVDRCKRVGIPHERIIYKTKIDLALEIVRRQREAGIRFDFVCADGLYGNSSKFCRALDDDNELFLLHVHSDQRLYLEDPRPEVPPPKKGRGRTPTRLRAQSDPIRVDALLEGLGDQEFERITVRKTTTGVLEIDAYRRKVWSWDGEEEKARCWTLFIRKDVKNSGGVKFCLSNVPESVPILMLARMEAQRFWIERSFEDAKGQAGMGEYQVRGWLAWHHHMALVMMAMLFMTRQRILYEEEVPLLSCYDIKVLLAYFLPKKVTSVKDIFTQMYVRHEKRQMTSENAAKRRQNGVKKARDDIKLPK